MQTCWRNDSDLRDLGTPKLNTVAATRRSHPIEHLLRLEGYILSGSGSAQFDFRADYLYPNRTWKAHGVRTTTEPLVRLPLKQLRDLVFILFAQLYFTKPLMRQGTSTRGISRTHRA